MAAADTTEPIVIPDGLPKKDNETAAEAIRQATELLQEKATVLAEIGTRRQLLHLLQGTGQVSDVQWEWIETYMPKRTRNTGDGADTTEA